MLARCGQDGRLSCLTFRRTVFREPRRDHQHGFGPSATALFNDFEHRGGRHRDHDEVDELGHLRQRTEHRQTADRCALSRGGPPDRVDVPGKPTIDDMA